MNKQPTVGVAVPDWSGCSRPPRTPLAGRYCRLEPLRGDIHACELYEGLSEDPEGRNFTYLSQDPFRDLDSYRRWLFLMETSELHQFMVVMDPTGKAAGLASYMRIDADMGVMEIGNIHFVPHLKRTPAATEAIYLLMKRPFEELGYRRLEWKCDSLNEASRSAAVRYGFTFEGIFRQACVYKGRNRDTAWYSMVDGEWPLFKPAFERWLEPANFDAAGFQRERLSELTAEIALGK